jgi:hypothetical protein
MVRIFNLDQKYTFHGRGFKEYLKIAGFDISVEHNKNGYNIVTAKFNDAIYEYIEAPSFLEKKTNEGGVMRSFNEDLLEVQNRGLQPDYSGGEVILMEFWYERGIKACLEDRIENSPEDENSKPEVRDAERVREKVTVKGQKKVSRK